MLLVGALTLGIVPWLTLAHEPPADAARPKLEPLPAKVPAPRELPQTPELIALGRKLFFDPRLSGDNRMSCGTCHLPEKAFADGLPLGRGAGGKTLARNTPTVLNVAFAKVLFWDGRATSLEEQALGPIQSPDEMHQMLPDLERELAAVPEYAAAFREALGTEVNSQGIARALAAYQRTLVSRNSPLDRFLAGDAKALSAEAQRGLELFRGDAGCIRCHHGPHLSDGKFHRIGVSFKDQGRAAVTGLRDDRYRFRTPTLRDVARTAPYMHDGSLKTLFDVVEFYFRTVPAEGPDGLKVDVEPLLGQSYSDMAAIVEFLEALSGEMPQ